MRTIKVELIIEIPSYYKIDKNRADFGVINDLLDALEERFSDVILVDGKIIGEQND